MPDDADETNSVLKGTVFSVQRYTVHDGPGTRTQIFLKGCPLRCKWCDNPESWSSDPEIGVFPQRCIEIEKCGYCMEACPVEKGDVFQVKDHRVTAINRNLCTGCLKCAEACPANALTTWGKKVTAVDQIREVCQDRAFFDETGGGVTVSGGEPYFQSDFTKALLKESKRLNLHTCVESAMPVSWKTIEESLPYIDCFITDIKLIDTTKHLEYTGVSNELILENIRKLSNTGTPMVVRVPVVPGHNDSEDNIRGTVTFLRQECRNAAMRLELLPFHELGKMKYDALGMSYPLKVLNKPSAEVYGRKMSSLNEIVRSQGLCSVSPHPESSGHVGN
ncbi:MAG: glycyl-radical enzyme activating protein [Deltaproteobacteria bacterium]|nr:glycyl-radical enzyme activating protein [Deltaproteobacteria bacterium]